MLRVLLDTPVLVAGFLGPDHSPAHALLEAHREGEFEIISSPRQLTELDGVLRHEAFAQQAGEGRGAAFVRQLASSLLFVADPYDLPHVAADRHHDLLVAVARAGGARFVVSSERDLVRSFVRDMTIATPEEFLAGLDRIDLAVRRAS